MTKKLLIFLDAAADDNNVLFAVGVISLLPLAIFCLIADFFILWKNAIKFLWKK